MRTSWHCHNSLLCFTLPRRAAVLLQSIATFLFYNERYSARLMLVRQKEE